MDKVTEVFYKIAGVNPVKQQKQSVPTTQAPTTSFGSSNGAPISNTGNTAPANTKPVGVQPAKPNPALPTPTSMTQSQPRMQASSTQSQTMVPPAVRANSNMPLGNASAPANVGASMPAATSSAPSKNMEQFRMQTQQAQEKFNQTYPNLSTLSPNELQAAYSGNTNQLTPQQLQELNQWKANINQNIWNNMPDDQRRFWVNQYIHDRDFGGSPLNNMPGFISSKQFQPQIEAWMKEHPPVEPNRSPNMSQGTAPQGNMYPTWEEAYQALDTVNHPTRELFGVESPESITNPWSATRNAVTTTSKLYNAARRGARLMRSYGAGLPSVGDAAGPVGSTIGSAVGWITGLGGGAIDSAFNAYERMQGRWDDPSAYWNATKGLVADNLDNAITGFTPGWRESAAAQAVIDTGLLANDAYNYFTTPSAPSMPTPDRTIPPESTPDEAYRYGQALVYSDPNAMNAYGQAQMTSPDFNYGF